MNPAIGHVSCKGRWLCPSSHQKKVQLFGALLTETILFPVPHRHCTFGISIHVHRPGLVRRIREALAAS